MNDVGVKRLGEVWSSIRGIIRELSFNSIKDLVGKAGIPVYELAHLSYGSASKGKLLDGVDKLFLDLSPISQDEFVRACIIDLLSLNPGFRGNLESAMERAGWGLDDTEPRPLTQQNSKESFPRGQSRLMSDAVSILKYLVDAQIVEGKSITAGELLKTAGIQKDAFDAADSYLLEQGYVDGTLGGLQGHRWITGNGIEFVESHLGSSVQVPRDSQTTGSPKRDMTMPDPRMVFVVHGRDESLRSDFFAFLRSLDLKPLQWSEAIKLTGKASPYIGEILDRAFNVAQAVLVLLSPDDEVRLHPDLHTQDEEPYELISEFQARPNVLFEAGMAFGRNPDRTLLIEVGKVKPFSDIAGRFTVRLTDAPEKRNDVAERLRTAGCSVDTSGKDWLRTGNFDVARSESKITSNDVPQEPIIKWVDMSYPEVAGIQASLESQGYQIRWCADDNLARRLDFEGWSIYYDTDSAGRKVILKIKDRTHDLILTVKPKSDKG